MRSRRSTKTRFWTCSSSASPSLRSSFFFFNASFSSCADAMYSGMATSFFCHAKKMLRRSTPFSVLAETKRVGVDSGTESGIGCVKKRCVACARSSVACSLESSGDVVGVGRLEAAIARRSASRGSCSAGSTVLAMVARTTGSDKVELRCLRLTEPAAGLVVLGRNGEDWQRRSGTLLELRSKSRCRHVTLPPLSS
ncbi:hypothetical protein VTN02DRAFT_6813 [Thermoascus thermophilus]